MLLIVAALTLSPGQAPQPPRVTEVPATETAKPIEFTARIGEMKTLSSPDPKARWELAPGTKGGRIVTLADGGVAFAAEFTGRYLAICYVDGPPVAWITITVGNTPDVKPDVDPKPPVPVNDPVIQSVKAAYESDAGKPYEKKQWAQILGGVWSAGVKFTTNQNVTTPKRLVELIREQVGENLKPDQLTATRRAIGEQIGKVFGAGDTTLTPEKRKEAADLFGKFVSALDDVSK